MKDNLVEAGRLAMRVEGENWVAYYAASKTMDGAVFLGSIRMATVVDNEERKQAFMEIMRGVVSEILQQALGVPEPTWTEPRSAPEHERAGSA